ncbi:MAG: hypothetical protein ACM34K_02000 [Bacillota bacterium]
MSNKGIIKFDDQIRPVSRRNIAEKLMEASMHLSDLTPLEKEELTFYNKDYLFEFESINDSIKISDPNPRAIVIFGKDPFERYRLLSYSNDIIKLNVSPIIGYETGANDGKAYSHSWTGLYFYGYLTDHAGFSFDYRDNTEKGDNADRKKMFTPATGLIRSYSQGNSFDYSEVRTSLSADWQWGNITIAKDFMEWGYGESGLLVLSRKSPSFPFINLNIKPADWLSFNYFHAWLSSDVTDSSLSYQTYRPGINRTAFEQKFLASHSFNLNPLKGLDITFGESVVYSDRLEIAYFMPLMFFRLADHYLSQGSNNAGSNSQFFASVSSRNHIKNTHLYGSILIDELTLSGLFDPKKQRTQIGFTLGGSLIDPSFLNLSLNLSLTLEYTKIYPFVYKHYIPTLTYATSGYTMGHWMGDNADLIYGALNYRFLRGLQASVWGEYVRKGEYGLQEGAVLQYKRPQPPFLFGTRSSYAWGGADAKYEITHELFVRGRFIYNAVTRGILPEHKSNEFYASIFYGM